jgi:hypothetical protein
MLMDIYSVLVIKLRKHLSPKLDLVVYAKREAGVKYNGRYDELYGRYHEQQCIAIWYYRHTFRFNSEVKIGSRSQPKCNK